jgi:UTP--glucose-1-phosphate uridylyltransferase
MVKVTKAVIAAAGFGTRFLPQTKAMPKEMLPLIDKPIIQYQVEQLVEAGIQDIIIVTNSSKRPLEDHFAAPASDLIANLEQGGPSKQPYIDELNRIADLANFIYIRQKGPYGNATPVLNAAHLIGDEPFIYIYADDLFVGSPSAYKQMVDMYDEFNTPIVPCTRIEKDEQYSQFGIVAGNELRAGVLNMNAIVEKPGIENAPSNIASHGGFILTPDIFEYIESAKDNLVEGAELYIQPMMQAMIKDGKKFTAFELQNSKYYDTGNRLEYLKTVVDFALGRDDMNEEFRTYLKSIL